LRINRLLKNVMSAVECSSFSAISEWMMKRVCLFAVVLAVVAQPSYASRGNMEVKIDQGCDFSQVNLDLQYSESPCTPVIKEAQIAKGLIGLFINVPEKIKLNESSQIVVCFTSILTLSDQEKFGGSELFVLEDVSSGKLYSSRLVDEEPDAPLPDGDDAPDGDMPSGPIQGYFNFLLSDYLKFRPHLGEYHLHVSMGPYKSNVASFKIVEDK